MHLLRQQLTGDKVDANRSKTQETQPEPTSGRGGHLFIRREHQCVRRLLSVLCLGISCGLIASVKCHDADAVVHYK